MPPFGTINAAFFGVILNGQEVLPKIISNTLLTIPVFHTLYYLYFQITMYKDSTVPIARKKGHTPTSDYYYCF